ncbi:unnamed protein product [Linum tenue]|uniref:SKP1-like protein n=1 Tax=Linum tenue TaxID=586396 RepID=A0AAV0MW62_9ROSI|nr:unnamed protein product [Linum tenue]
MSTCEANGTTEPSPATAEGKTITLKSGDGEMFQVEEAVAMELATVKNFFDDGTIDSGNAAAVIPLPNVSAQPLSRIIVYCRKQVEFRGSAAAESEKRSFSDEFVKKLELGEVRDLVLAANYLNIPYLLDVLNQNIADRIQNKSVEFVRKFFGIENDFTPEEEQAIRDQNAWAFEGVDED